MGSKINSHQGKEKDKKKKTPELSVRGGAGCKIEGLVALGGALAAAALIAALTNKARKRRPITSATQNSVEDPPRPTGLTKTSKNNSQCSCAEGGNEGLRSFLRTPSQSVQCQHSNCFFCDEGLSRIVSTHINFSELAVVQSLILEANVSSSKETDEKPSDNKEAWNIPAFEFDDIKAGTPLITIEELPLLIDGTSSLKQENIEEGDDVGGSDEIPSVKAKGRGENNGSYKQPEEEEGSEGTPDSSVESSAEAVWPAESIEAEMVDFEDTKAYCLYSVEKAKDGAKKDEITGSRMEILDPQDRYVKP